MADYQPHLEIPWRAMAHCPAKGNVTGRKEWVDCVTNP